MSGLKRTLASSAELYIFADKYLIKSLKLVALLCLQEDFKKLYAEDIAWSRGNEGSFECIMKLLELTFDTRTAMRTLDNGIIRI